MCVCLPFFFHRLVLLELAECDRSRNDGCYDGGKETHDSISTESSNPPYTPFSLYGLSVYVPII